MSVRISKKYGVNPSVTRCKCCGAEYGIAMFGTSYKDKNGKTAEAPHEVVMGLCDTCQSTINQGGIILIEVKDGESGDTPYRTGRIIGITKDSANKIFKDIISPINYMEKSLFSKLFDKVLAEKKEEDVTDI